MIIRKNTRVRLFSSTLTLQVWSMLSMHTTMMLLSQSDWFLLFYTWVWHEGKFSMGEEGGLYIFTQIVIPRLSHLYFTALSKLQSDSNNLVLLPQAVISLPTRRPVIPASPLSWGCVVFVLVGHFTDERFHTPLAGPCTQGDGSGHSYSKGH